MYVLYDLIYNIFLPLDLSESEKDITTSNEVEYLTDIFQTEDDLGKCKVINDSGLDSFWTTFGPFGPSVVGLV